jgi:two-component system, NarL family, response regulator YdfI
VVQITPAERAALQLLATGSAKREVANRLQVTERDIDLHLATLFARLGAASQSEAVAAALRRGLLH